MNDVFVHSEALMGTVVTIQVVGHGANRDQAAERRDAVHRALARFRDINDRCSRFDPASELSRLSHRVNEPVETSATLFEAIRFALKVAEVSGGAFDPTIGGRIESMGFNREYRTGTRVTSDTDPAATYRDITLDECKRTVTLHARMMIDLGAVAKGLAIDMAARELQPLRDFAIDAGGDLYLGGHGPFGRPWSVGIRHPRTPYELLGKLRVSNASVCTSGDYERMNEAGTHHIVDARTGNEALHVASVTVKAPSAMVADALATAAFALGPRDGIALLESQGVGGIIVTPWLDQYETRGVRAE